MVRWCLVALVAVFAGCAMAQPAAPADDAAEVARGKRLFLHCASCHDIHGETTARIGPTLKGVFGRKVASVPGYGYSKSLAAQSFTWDEQRLDAWLKQPTSIASGTTMAFEGLADAADRQAVIAYLKTQKH